MALFQGRRIVTGHDAQGRSIVISDDAPKNVVPNPDKMGGGVATKKVEYSQDLFAKEALEFYQGVFGGDLVPIIAGNFIVR